jgi:hypothetical protein
MAEVVAIGSLIGAKIAAAGAAVGTAAAAHPFLAAGAILGAGFGAYRQISAGTAQKAAFSSQAEQAYMAGQSQVEQLRFLQAQNRQAYAAEQTQAATEGEERQRRLQQLMATQLNLFGSGNVDITGVEPILTDSFEQSATEQRRAALASNGRLTGYNNEFASLGLDMGTARVNAGQQAANYKQKGNSAYTSGLMQAGGTLINAGLNFAQVGGVPKGSSTKVKKGFLSGLA